MTGMPDNLKMHQKPKPFSLVLIGALAMHGAIDAAQIVTLGERAGLDAAAQSRAVLDVIDRGVASFMRSGDEGQLVATPALADMPRAERVCGILANIALPAHAFAPFAEVDHA